MFNGYTVQADDRLPSFLMYANVILLSRLNRLTCVARQIHLVEICFILPIHHLICMVQMVSQLQRVLCDRNVGEHERFRLVEC